MSGATPPQERASDEGAVDATVADLVRDAQEALAPQRQTTPFLVLQFFVFPMAIVAVCVAVFAIFGLIASEGKGAREHLQDLRRGGGMFDNQRWQAAFALSGAIDSQRDALRRDPRFAAELLQAFEESKQWPDRLVRRYLVLAMGRLGDPQAVPVLRATLAQPEGGGDDVATRLYALWALGAIADPAGLPELLAAAGHADAGVRKAAIHALGAFRDEASRDALRRALADAAADVRWNAALALARRADATGVPVLREMLDRRQLAGVDGLQGEQADLVVEQAVAAAAALGAAELRPALEQVRDADPSLKARAAARQALATTARP